MKRFMLLGVGLLAFSGVASATGQKAGIGAGSCGAFLSGDSSEYIGWAQGFMTGLNIESVVSKHLYRDLPDPASMEVYLQKYCSDHPLKTFLQGVDSMYFELPLLKDER